MYFRPLCQKVQKSCVGVLEDFGYSWPQVLNCSKFPENNNHQHMCMNGPSEDEAGDGDGGDPNLTPTLFNTLQTNPLFREKVKERLSNSEGKLDDTNYKTYKDYVDLLDSNLNRMRQDNDRCGKLKVIEGQYRHVSRLGSCVAGCNDDVLFDKTDKRNAEIVMGVGAALAFSATVFTLVTFCLSPERFLYPERALIFVTFSVFGLSLGYLLRLLLGRDSVACQDDLLTIEGHRDSECFLVFLFVFYFSSAASAWFTVTSMILFVTSLFRVARHRELRKYVTFFHLFGWGLPAALTVTALVMHKIEAGELKIKPGL